MVNIWSRSSYELVPRSEALKKAKRVLSTRFMYKIKWLDNPAYVALPANLEGNVTQFIINKFKARWIVCGYNLKKGWDYIESCADADRILIATSVWFGTHLVSNDFQCFWRVRWWQGVRGRRPRG